MCFKLQQKFLFSLALILGLAACKQDQPITPHDPTPVVLPF
jgi:hypothetical protein